MFVVWEEFVVDQIKAGIFEIPLPAPLVSYIRMLRASQEAHTKQGNQVVQLNGCGNMKCIELLLRTQ